MEPDATDDPQDADYEVISGRGVWTPTYLRKFTKLLTSNTVVLQQVQNYPRDDPIHELKRQAMEHMRVTLGMETADQVRHRISIFRKFAATRGRQLADRCSRNATPEQILKNAPRWLRELQPHLNLWTKLASRKSNAPAPAPAPAPVPAPAPAPAPPTQKQARVGRGGSSTGGSTCVSRELIRRASELRTLEARLVCRDIPNVPADKQEELQYVWWRMLDVVRQKLSIQRDAGCGGSGGAGGAGGARLSRPEEHLADLVLLLDDTITTLGEAADYDSLQEQVSLFHLAQQQALEMRLAPATAPAPAHWTRALRVHRVKHNKLTGLYISIILLQRRWHELKLAARQAFVAYTRPKPGQAEMKPPSPLHATIVRRFPHVVTSPARSWRDLVNAGLVVETEIDQPGTDATPAAGPSAGPSVGPSAGPSGPSCESYQTFALRHLRLGDPLQPQEEEDDLIVIEREIETIDLINGTDEQRQRNQPVLTYAFHDHLPDQLRSKRQNIAVQLESELDKQLQQLTEPSEREDASGAAAGSSEMTLFNQEAQGPTMFLYDSDEELHCSEDRIRNIEMIASQLATDDNADLTVRVKQEVVPTVPTPTVDEPCTLEGRDEGGRDEGGRGGGGDEGVACDADNTDDDCVSIDKKLLMVTQVSLEKVDSSLEWRRHAKRTSTIHIGHLHPRFLAPKRSREASASEKPADDAPQLLDTKDSLLKVKMEKNTEESDSTGSRLGKLRARQLIAEILRDDPPPPPTAPHSPPDDDPSTRLTKKVLLPNIEEVRKNNLSMLTAQVAPLTAAAGGLGGQGGASTSANEATGNDVTAGASSDVTASAGHDDVTLSRNELDQVLKRLAEERSEVQLELSSVIHCCTARRQHAMNAARIRIAARAARNPPPPIDIHSTSQCARNSATCTCCCGHLLSASVSEWRLKQASRDFAAALARLAGKDVNPSASAANKSGGSRKPVNVKKNPPEGEKSTPSPPGDSLQEWIRQKNLNQQYFNLNLKAKPSQAPGPLPRLVPKPTKQNATQALAMPALLPIAVTAKEVPSTQPEMRKFLLVPTDGDPNCKPRVVYTHNIKQPPQPPPPPPPPPASTPALVMDPALIAAAPAGSLASTKPNEPQLKLPTNPTPMKVTSSARPRVKPAARSRAVHQITLNTANALSMVKQPSRTVPGGTLLKVSLPSIFSAPPASGSASNKAIPLTGSATSASGVQVTSGPASGQPRSTSGPATPRSQTITVGNFVKINKSNILRPVSLPAGRQVVMKRDPLNSVPKPTDAGQRTPAANGSVEKGQGPSMAWHQLAENLRGTGMKVIKISSSPEPRSLLKGTFRSPQKSNPGVLVSSPSPSPPGSVRTTPSLPQRVINTQRADQLYTAPLLSGGAVLTKLKMEQQNQKVLLQKQQLKAKSNQLYVNIPDLFKRTHRVVSAASFPGEADPSTIVVQCIDQTAPLLTLDKYYVLSDWQLNVTTPTYWTIGPHPHRVVLNDAKDKTKNVDKSVENLNAEGVPGGSKGVPPPGEGKEETAVMAAPDKMFLQKKMFLKLKEEPLLYARVMFAVRSSEECRAELTRGAPLHLVLGATGHTSPLKLSAPFGPPAPLHMSHPDQQAVQALAKMLNELPPLPWSAAATVTGGPLGAPPARADVNARADVVMMLNNVSRKPIEMVYVDSDDEGQQKKDFKGLEMFEELEEFDL